MQNAESANSEHITLGVAFTPKVSHSRPVHSTYMVPEEREEEDASDKILCQSMGRL